MSSRTLTLGRPLLGNMAAQKWIWSYLGVFLLFIVIMFISGSPVETLAASISFASFFVLVGIGQMLVITTGPGNIDLAVPNTMALTGLAAMKVMAETDSHILIGLIVALIVGSLVGAFNFSLIRFAQMPPMIATLASSFVLKTLSIVFFRGLQLKPPKALEAMVHLKILGIPLLFVLVLIISFVMHYILTRSSYGRQIHAIGQNTKAAWLTGINVNRRKLLTYMLSGFFAALTGCLLAAFSGGATLDMGNEYMLNSIAVVVLGGSSMAGGDSNIPGIIGASILLYLIVNALNIIGLSVSLRYIFTGLAIVGIIIASGERNRKA